MSPSVVSQSSGAADAAFGDAPPRAIDVGSLGGDTVNLKASAPTPTFPTNNVVVQTRRPRLSAANARGTYRNATFEHVFAVYKVTGGIPTLVETGTAAQGPDASTFQLTSDLDANATYQWRVRAMYDGAYGPWSPLASFRTPAFVIIGVPIPTFPVGGIVIRNFRPDFNVINGVNEGETGQVIYQMELATDSNFTNIIEVAGTHARPRGDTNIPLQNTLQPLRQYFWRVRGRNDGQGRTQLIPGSPTVDVISAWSAVQNFFTPAAVTAPPSQCCPPPNRFAVVVRVASQVGYPASGDDQFFTQRVAEELYAEDANWGRRLNPSGTISADVVAYKVDGQANNPFSIDMVSGAGGSNPVLHWDPHGRVGGTWIAP